MPLLKAKVWCRLALILVSSAIASCDTPSRSLRSAKSQLFGVWSGPATSTSTSFRGDVTNVVLKVYNVVGAVQTQNLGGRRLELVASMFETQRNGEVLTDFENHPVILTGGIMVVPAYNGSPQDFLLFGCTQKEDTLQLWQKCGETFWKAELRKLALDPGQPGPGPDWVREWRELERKFVGVWQGVEYASDFYEFAGATNMTFFVYGIGPMVKSESQVEFWSALGKVEMETRKKTENRMLAELVLDYHDGTQKIAGDSEPVYLREHAITFGWPDPFILRYTFTNGLLVLENSGQSTIKAKLRKITEDPGRPRFSYFMRLEELPQASSQRGGK